MVNQHRPPWASALQAERESRAWGTWALARRLYAVVGIENPNQTKVRSLARQINRHEQGRHFPVEWASAYAAVYGIPEDELFTGRGHTVTVEETETVGDWDVMERRRLLLAALGLGAGALSEGNAQRLVDLVLTSEPRSVEAWQQACSDHLHAIHTRPPLQVKHDLFLDLLALDRQTKAASPNDLVPLWRAQVQLSSLYANALTRLGAHGSALRWWRTARDTAEALGDLNYRIMVRNAEAGFGLYGQRDLASILRTLEEAEQLAGAAGVHPRTLCARAKALSLLGRDEQARKALRTTADLSEASHSDPLWQPDQVWFAESWVYAAAGEESKADAARERVLAQAYVSYQYAANVRLHEALCTVVRGGTDRGATQATTILYDLPPTHQSQMIIETARMVLRAVPVAKRDRAPVRDLHAAVA
jgi:hypothetical protein